MISHNSLVAEALLLVNLLRVAKHTGQTFEERSGIKRIMSEEKHRPSEHDLKPKCSSCEQMGPILFSSV